MYFSLNIRMINAWMKVKRFAIVTGKSPIEIPYTNHRKTPTENAENIPNEISFVDFVFHVFIN